jgi:hypothetical protein
VSESKFTNEDGSVNTDALQKSYAESQAEATRMAQELAELKKQMAEKPAPKEANSVDDLFGGNPGNDPAAIWNKINEEIAATGNVSDETREVAKRTFNASDDMLNSVIAGQRAQGELSLTQAAARVGGMEALRGLVDWAKTNLAPEEVSAFRKALEGPGREFAVDGMMARMQAATGRREPSVSQGTANFGGAVSDEVVPFETREQIVNTFRTGGPYHTIPEARRKAEQQALKSVQEGKFNVSFRRGTTR